MDDSLKDKITILVNVHNRQQHLSRQLDYIHAHYERILVLDSSDTEYAGKDDYPNVEYHYYPGWEYVDKLADIIKKVKTPYVHLCADDDFYVPEAVYSCVAFMEKHADYASAHGHYRAFHWDGKHFDVSPLYTHYIDRDIENEDVAIRLEEVFASYIQLLYGVHRIENLRDCFCLASERKVTNHRLVELLVTAVAIVNGKHKVLPLLYGMRETLYNSAGTFVPTIEDVLKSESSAGEYERFVGLIASCIHFRYGISQDTAASLFEKAFRQYVASRRRKLKTSPQLLPSRLRIIINRMRYRNWNMRIAGHELRQSLETIESYVRTHNC